jgi:hypothetical protein
LYLLDAVKGLVAGGPDHVPLKLAEADWKTLLLIRTVPIGKEIPSTSVPSPKSSFVLCCFWQVRLKPSWKQPWPMPKGYRQCRRRFLGSRAKLLGLLPVRPPPEAET